jgi:hypothetical protein
MDPILVGDLRDVACKRQSSSADIGHGFGCARRASAIVLVPDAAHG